MEIPSEHLPMQDVRTNYTSEASSYSMTSMPMLTRAQHLRYGWLFMEKAVIRAYCGAKHSRLCLLDREMCEIEGKSLTNVCPTESQTEHYLVISVR